MNNTTTTNEKTDRRKCGNCMFWERSELEDGSGCLRYPPTIVPYEGTLKVFFPHMNANEWCGEHKWKDSERPKGDPVMQHRDDDSDASGLRYHVQHLMASMAGHEFTIEESQALINMVKLRTRA